MAFTTRAFLLSIAATAASAQYGPGGRYGPSSDNDNNYDYGDGYGYGYGYDYDGGRGEPSQDFVSKRQQIIIAHGVLASLAFVILFPVGSILIRLGTFRGAWLVHGLFQLFAYLIYIAAFGIGVWIVNNIPVNLLDHYHPIIGIVVFALLFFQPILGFVHHLKFKKYSRRTVWSYGHLWLGRIIITLGIINGGLGLLLASEAPAFTGFAPSKGQITAYGVIAGIMWLLWVAAAIIGERRRATGNNKLAAKQNEIEQSSDTERPSNSMELHGTPPTYKEHYAHRVHA